MTTQFRDTQLGYVVRFLSSNKLFRYPDEIDSSLWKESIQRDTSSKDKRSGKQNGALEKPQEPNDATNASPTDVETQGVGLQDAEHVVEAGKDIYLVDWYGPDDPEVSAPIGPMHRMFLTLFRILGTGPGAGSCWSLSKSALLTSQSTLRVPSTFLVRRAS